MYRRYNRRYTRPYRRRYTRTNYARRSRRKFSRRSAPRRRLTDGTTYRFKRTFLSGQLVSSATIGTTIYGAYNFSLDDVTNYTEFTTLFDSYKLSGVKLRFIPRQTDNDSLATSPGQFMYVPDYDDDTIPVSVTEIMERQSSKIQQMPGEPFTIFLRPKAGILTTVSGGAQFPNAWIKTATGAAAPHYGLKWAWTLSNSTQTIDVYMTYYLKFKAVK